MSGSAPRPISCRGGLLLPRLGLGTWEMGRSGAERAAEVRAIRLALDLGICLIDTAEMYDDAESVVGDALAETVANGRRGDVMVVSKVMPHNASRRGTIAACEESLRKLRIDAIDLYLLHWTGSHPLADTLAAFSELRARGEIRAFGVSNFDTADMDECERLPGGAEVAVNQILYNPLRRGPERRLIPWCRERGVGVMGYSPLEQGRVPNHPTIAEIAERHDATAAQVTLAWVMAQPGVQTIVKTSSEARLRENVAACELVLSPEDLAAIDSAYPAPEHDVPLECW